MTGQTTPGERGQTTMDFAAGISIFLVTVAFAFAFVPGIIAPFADTGTADPVTANRLADDLATDRFAEPGEEYVLDAERAGDFFADPDAIGRLAVPQYRTVNVTVENATAGKDSSIVDLDGERAAAGPEVPSSADVTAAWRAVTVGDRRLELVVRVW